MRVVTRADSRHFIGDCLTACGGLVFIFSFFISRPVRRCGYSPKKGVAISMIWGQGYRER